MTVPNGAPGITPPDFGVTNDGTIPNLPARSQTVAENYHKAKVQGSPSWAASTPIFTSVVNMLIATIFHQIADAVGTIPIVGGALSDVIDGFASWLAATEGTANTAQATAESKSKTTKGSTAPSSPAASDIWIDTSTGSNVYKVWNGSAWVVTTDKIAIDAANDAAAAQSTANTANSTANTANTTANTANTTANTANSTANAALAAVPSLSALSKAFSGDVDATFDRILLPANWSVSHGHTITGNTANTTPAGGSSHNHGNGTLDAANTSVGPGVPDYQPAGNTANKTELGYLKCSRDRTYTKMTFNTGNSWTALGVTAFYLGVYSVNLSTGALTLVSSTGDIKASVSSTNTEYTFTLGSSISATKGNVYACGTLQVTSAVQTCNSLCRLSFWPLSGPAGVYPSSLYAYTASSTTLASSHTDASLTKNANFAPYYALS